MIISKYYNEQSSFSLILTNIIQSMILNNIQEVLCPISSPLDNFQKISPRIQWRYLLDKVIHNLSGNEEIEH